MPGVLLVPNISLIKYNSFLKQSQVNPCGLPVNFSPFTIHFTDTVQSIGVTDSGSVDSIPAVVYHGSEDPNRGKRQIFFYVNLFYFGSNLTGMIIITIKISFDPHPAKKKKLLLPNVRLYM